ncbi:MAG: hypothetical protein V7L05_22110 [Nostoc sp.]
MYQILTKDALRAIAAIDESVPTPVKSYQKFGSKAPSFYDGFKFCGAV